MIGASLNPDWFEEKVRLFIGLAPIARLDHSDNQAMVIGAPIWPILSELVKATGMYNLVPENGVSDFLSAEFCFVLPHFCEKLLDGFFDFDDKIDNADRIADK